MRITEFKRKDRLMVAAAVGLGLLAGASAAWAQDDGDWGEYHRDYRGWRYSPLDQISTQNVKKLRVAWIHQAGEIAQGLQATPLAVGGVVYYSASNNRVFALDATTGEEIWKYIPELDPIQEQSLFGFYNRGVSVGRGKVYVGSADGRVIALDQKTGKELWAVQLTDPKRCNGCNFTSPPQLANDVLIAGPTGGDLAQHGQIYGLDADTGEKLWAFEVLRDSPESWPGDSREHGGGAAWLPGQFDPESGLFIMGTSNPAPDLNASGRKGDNLYTGSILALSPKTGKLVWHHQEVPMDTWDFDSQYEVLMLDKEGEKVLMHLNKGGFVTILDRSSGKVVNVWRLAQNVNWVKDVDTKTGALVGRHEPQMGKPDVFCPSVLGARSWNAGAYSPQTGLWYTNAHEFCMKVASGKQDVKDMAFSQPYFGVSAFDFVPPPDGKASARLAAYEPLSGKQVWSVDYDLPGLGGVLATAGGLVFNGDSHGLVHAYDNRSGEELWKFNTGSGIRGGIISYSAAGKQYVLVPSGFGSLFPGFASSVFPAFKDIRGGAALIAFVVD
ncbi:MAG: PQQ-binding-like beta-propeller repeat protein [Rhodocyclaceae bacterium]|nr:PQQ-binding-like beta-propeller repeat protein [Rhodocyclaceae bacterium]